MTLSGRCLCEAVTYEIVGPVRDVVNCSSTLFWRTDRRPDRLSIAAGTITPPTGLETIATIYREYASDYHIFDESIPNFGEDMPDHPV